MAEEQSDFSVIGSTGLQKRGGVVTDDIERELQGAQGRARFTEMSMNDPVVHGILFAIDMLIRRIEWTVQPANEDNASVEAAEFMSSVLDDMSLSWEDTLSEILTMLIYGWSYLEVVYKIRGGESDDPTRKSQFEDGRIGWRKLVIRAQESLDRWEFDDEGGIQGMWQVSEDGGQSRLIPIQKSLLFRTSVRKGNPEGRSILRSAWFPYYYQRSIQEIEAIGVERDLAGLPTMGVPPEVLRADSEEHRKIRDLCLDLVTRIRRDEQEGVLIPRQFDDLNNERYKLELLASGGGRQFNTDGIIERYDQRKAMAMLADFIMLGHQNVGSHALATSKVSLFMDALKAWTRSIASVMNEHGITRLMRLNGIPSENWPKMHPGVIQEVDVNEVIGSLQRLAAAGMPIFPNPGLERRLYELLDLPVPEELEGS